MKAPEQIIETNAEFDKWLETEPLSIKKLAKEFEFGTVWLIKKNDLVVIGWNEKDTVIFSKLYLNSDTTPDIDKMFSTEERIYICAKHLRRYKI